MVLEDQHFGQAPKRKFSMVRSEFTLTPEEHLVVAREEEGAPSYARANRQMHRV